MNISLWPREHYTFGKGGGEKLLLFRTLVVRHSGAGQPRMPSGKQMVAKAKANDSASNSSYR